MYVCAAESRGGAPHSRCGLIIMAEKGGGESVELLKEDVNSQNEEIHPQPSKFRLFLHSFPKVPYVMFHVRTVSLLTIEKFM